MNKKIGLLVLVIVMVLSLVVAGCAPKAEPAPTPTLVPEETYEWGLQSDGPQGSAAFILQSKWADRVEKTSNGRLSVKVFPTGEIVPRNEHAIGVRDGAVDAAIVMGHDDIGRIGPSGYLMLTSGLPGGANSLEMMAWVYKGGGLEVMNDVYKDFGIFPGAWCGAAEVFCYSNKKLDTAESMEGVKFRTAGMWAEILQTFGATVVMIPGGEVYQACERGVIDAFELGPPAYNWPLGFHEITKYMGVPGIHSPGSGNPLLVNHNSWNELPNDLKAIVADECIAMAIDSYQEQQLVDAVAMQNYRDYGTEIFTVQDDFQKEIAKRSKEYIVKFAEEDDTFRSVWESQQNFYKMWRGLTTELIAAYTIYD